MSAKKAEKPVATVLDSSFSDVGVKLSSSYPRLVHPRCVDKPQYLPLLAAGFGSPLRALVIRIPAKSKG
jgi:hypothetical protein